MAQEFDLTKDVESFTSADMPVILRNTGPSTSIADEIVALRITAFGGLSLADKPGVLGVMSSAMSKGTYRFSKEKIDETLTRTGAVFSISPSKDAVHISLKCLKRFLPEVLPIVSEVLRVPKFDQKEIDLILDRRHNNLKSEKDHPDSLLGLKMHQIFFQGHPYSIRAAGFLDTIKTITRTELVTAHQKAFNKMNLLFTFVGSLDRPEAENILKTYFAAIPSGSRARDINQAFNNETSKIHFTQYDAPTNYFMAKFKAPSLESKDYPAMSIALQILDNRLFEEVRTKRALTYSVSASMGNSRVNSGQLYTTSTKLLEAVSVIFEEVKKLQVATVSPQNIELQVNKFLSNWYLSRETNTNQAAIFSLYEVMGIGWENSNSFIRRLSRVSPQDIQTVMRKYMRDFSFVVVGREKPAIEAELQRLGFFEGELAENSKAQPEAQEKATN